MQNNCNANKNCIAKENAFGWCMSSALSTPSLNLPEHSSAKPKLPLSLSLRKPKLQ